MERPRKVGPSPTQSSRGKVPSRVFTLNSQEVYDPDTDMLGMFFPDESI